MADLRIDAIEDVPVLHEASVVTIGVFDGLHLGHRSILEHLNAAGRARGLPTVCVTFSVHPKAVLTGEPPRHILSLDHRLALLHAAGVDDVIVVAFSERFAAIEAETFVRELLVERLGVRELVVGHDTAIGRGRRGDAAFLARAGREHDFEVVAVGGVTVDGRRCSSTTIREAIARGDLRTASRMLGRTVSLLGRIVRGEGRGATIGFPTANLEVVSEAFPPRGVYAVTARTVDGDVPGVMNYGSRPTFEQDEEHAVFEIHVLDAQDLDLYGQRMEVFLHAFLRPERRFESAGALVEQIRRDCAAARDVPRLLPPRASIWEA